MADALEAGKAFLDIVPRAGEAFAAELEGEMRGPFARLSGMGSALGTALKVGIVAGVLAAGPALFEIGESFEKAYDKIRVGTGKTGEALKGLEETMKGVATDVPTSLGSAGDAVAILNRQLGLTGEPLRSMADRMLELSRITKTDLTTNVTAAAEAFNNWGVSAADQGPKLDELFRVSQATGVSVSDLASSMASGGAVARTVGLNFEQSAALMGLLSKAGVSATSVMQPLSRAIATAAKEGKNASDVLKSTFDAIRTAPDATAAAGAAIAVFGARAGPKLAGLIREGQLSYEDLAKTIAAGGDTILSAGEDTQHFGDKMKMAWNRILVAVEPVATKVAEFVTELAGHLGPELTVVFDDIGKAWNDALEGFRNPEATVGPGASKLRAIFVKVGEVVRAVVDPVKAFLYTLRTGFTQDEGTPIERFALLIRDDLIPALKVAIGFIRDHLKPILIGVGVAFALLVAPITTTIAALVYLYVRFGSVRAAVAGAIAGVKAFVSFLDRDVAPVVRRVVTYISGQISALVVAVRTRWAAISEAFRHALKAIEVLLAIFLAPFVLAWRAAHDQILAIVRLVWDQIRSVVDTAVRIVRDVIDVVLSLINGDWGKAWSAVKDLLGAAWDFITNLVGNALSALRSMLSGELAVLGSLWGIAWGAIRDAVGAAWDWIKGIVSTGADAVVGFVASLPGRIASAAVGMWNGITSAFKSAINGIISIWNNLSFPSVTFHIPHVPGTNIGGDITIGGWQLPNIPYLARGADIAGGGLAVVGDRGPELVRLPTGATVVPLDVARMIATAAKSADRGPLYAIVNLDGREIGRAQFTTTRTVERGKR